MLARRHFVLPHLRGTGVSQSIRTHSRHSRTHFLSQLLDRYIYSVIRDTHVISSRNTRWREKIERLVISRVRNNHVDIRAIRRRKVNFYIANIINIKR